MCHHVGGGIFPERDTTHHYFSVTKKCAGEKEQEKRCPAHVRNVPVARDGDGVGGLAVSVGWTDFLDSRVGLVRCIVDSRGVQAWIRCSRPQLQLLRKHVPHLLVVEIMVPEASTPTRVLEHLETSNHFRPCESEKVSKATVVEVNESIDGRPAPQSTNFTSHVKATTRQGTSQTTANRCVEGHCGQAPIKRIRRRLDAQCLTE